MSCLANPCYNPCDRSFFVYDLIVLPIKALGQELKYISKAVAVICGSCRTEREEVLDENKREMAGK